MDQELPRQGKRPLPTAPRPTRVEDAGGQRGRRGLVQEQLPHHHPQGVPGEPALQEPHPEEVEVSMETERDDGHVPRLPPVHFPPPREPLVHDVAPGEQPPVQRDVDGPREPTDVSQQRLSHRGPVSQNSGKKSPPPPFFFLAKCKFAQSNLS